MEQQEFLMMEDVYEAMKRAGQAIVAFHEPSKIKSWSKVIGHMLWPTKSPEDASKLWNNCMDKTRPEKLDPEQYLWLKREAKRCGCHILHAFDCDYTEYQVSNPVEPRDEVADLQKQYISAARQMKEIADRIESKLNVSGPYNMPSRPKVA